MSPESLDIKGMVAEICSLPPPLTPIKFESRASPLHSISAAAIPSEQRPSQQPSASLPDPDDDTLKDDLDFSDDSEDSGDDNEDQSTAQRQNTAPIKLENDPESIRHQQEQLFGPESDDDDDNDVETKDVTKGATPAPPARPPSAEMPRKSTPSKNLFDDDRSSSSSSSSDTDSGSEEDDDEDNEVAMVEDEEEESVKIEPHSSQAGGSNSPPPSPHPQIPGPPAATQWCLGSLYPSLAQQTTVLAAPEKVEDHSTQSVKIDVDADLEETSDGDGRLGAEGDRDGSEFPVSVVTSCKLESSNIPFDGGEPNPTELPYSSTNIKSESNLVAKLPTPVSSVTAGKHKDKSRPKSTPVSQQKTPKNEIQNYAPSKREPISSEFVPSDSDSNDSDEDVKPNIDANDANSNVNSEKFIPPSSNNVAVKRKRNKEAKTGKDDKANFHAKLSDRTNDPHPSDKEGVLKYSPVEKKINTMIHPPAFDPDDDAFEPPMYTALDGVDYDRKGFPSIIVQWSLFLFDVNSKQQQQQQQQKRQQEQSLTKSESAKVDSDSEREFIKKVVDTPIKVRSRSSSSSSNSSDDSSSDEESDSSPARNLVDAAPDSQQQSQPTPLGNTPSSLASPLPPPSIDNVVYSASPLAPPPSSVASSDLSPMSQGSSNSVTPSIAAEIGGGPNQSLPPPYSPYKSQKSSSILNKPLTPLGGDSPLLAKSPKGFSGSGLKKTTRVDHGKDDINGCKKPTGPSSQDQQHISQLLPSPASSTGHKKRRHGDKSSRSSSPSHTFESKIEDSRGSRPISDHESQAASEAFKSLVGGNDFSGVGASNAAITVMNVEGVASDSFLPTNPQPPKRLKKSDDDSKALLETASQAAPPLYSNLSTDGAVGGNSGQKCWPPEDSPSAPEVSSSTVDSPPIASTNSHPPESCVDVPTCQSGGASISRTDVGQSSSVTSSAQVSIPVHPFMQQKRLSADEYLKLAKGLKHRADKMGDKTKKYMTYIDAVLAFSQCGYEMENEGNRQQEDIYKMYDDTVRMLQHVFGKFKSSEPNDTERKVYVLNLRVQALLNQKLFRFKRADASRHSQILQRELYGRNATVAPRMIGSSPSAAASSPYQANSIVASSSGAPSPATSSHGGAALSPLDATVAIPVRCHSYNQRYKSVMDLVLTSYEMWDQADFLANQLKEFFSQIESKCGSIHLSCTILDLARYVKESLKLLGHDNSSC